MILQAKCSGFIQLHLKFDQEAGWIDKILSKMETYKIYLNDITLAVRRGLPPYIFNNSLSISPTLQESGCSAVAYGLMAGGSRNLLQ